MPKFLSQQEIYRLLQREMPEDVAPDGAPSAFYSTAEMDSVAKVLSTSYQNLSVIYSDNYPQTTSEDRIADWEIKVFGNVKPANLTLQERRDRVLAKLRLPRGLTKTDIEGVVRGVLGTAADFEIVEWGCEDGSWILDYSELGVGTILNGTAWTFGIAADLCSKSPSDYGLTADQWAEMQETAYTYEVKIFNQTLTADQYLELDRELLIWEPARSRHVITDGLTEDDRTYGEN